MAHSGKTITFATDLLPNEDNIYNLGSSNKKWKIFGNVTGNADGLTHKTLDNTTINNTAGTFAFSGSGAPWASTDWVGLQVGDSVDKFQITANGNNLLFRQNDSGGTNTSWQSWVTLLSSGNTAAGTNNNATLTWSTTYTIAKINGTDIKFTTMAKPTYTASDVGALASGTTVTNVAISADTTTNKNYAIVFATTANDGTNPTAAKTEGLQKNSAKFYVNPSTGALYATKLYSGGTEVSVSGHTHSYLPLSGGNLTGTLGIKPASGEGGELHLKASTEETDDAGIVLDNYHGVFRIFGIASADGTTVTGTGSPLYIDPYAKTITGGYTITGTLSGNATSASKIAAKLATTTKTTLLGVSAATTLSGTATNVELIGDTGIYLTTTAGEISALRYSIHDSSTTPVEKARLEWNSTDQAIEFIFA